MPAWKRAREASVAATSVAVAGSAADADGGPPYALLTVGSTRFDELIDVALTPAFADALGVRRVVAQVGASAAPATATAAARAAAAALATLPAPRAGAGASADAPTTAIYLHGGVVFELFRYCSAAALRAAMRGAAAVVAHAGAGSACEAMRETAAAGRGARVVLVVNDTLAGNHQVELAAALAERGHCAAALDGPQGLLRLLRQRPLAVPVPLPPAAPGLAAFAHAVQAAMS